MRIIHIEYYILYLYNRKYTTYIYRYILRVYSRGKSLTKPVRRIIHRLRVCIINGAVRDSLIFVGSRYYLSILYYMPFGRP